MKVAFWNGTGLCGNVTGYLAAMSAYCAICLGKTVYVSSNHLKDRRLEDYFFNNSSKSGKERFLDCYLYGEPEYFRKLWEDKGQRHSETRTLTGIRLLDPPDISDDVMFHSDVPEESVYFLDIPGGMNASSAKALEEADVVAVFLPQDKTEIHIFFDCYSSIIPKALFFIADYRKERKCTPEYLQRNYGVPKEHTGIIPYDSTFEYLCELGEMEEFFRKESSSGSKSEEEIRKHLKKAIKMILGFTEKKENYKEEHELSK